MPEPSEWTPDTKTVRQNFTWAIWANTTIETPDDSDAAFDRWLAAERSRIGREVIVAAADGWSSATGMFTGAEVSAWLRGLAERIGGER